MEVFRVAANSQPKLIAGAIAINLRQNTKVEVQAVGAAAVNQAVKAIAIARGFLIPNNINIVMTPAFYEVEINGDERTAIKFIVEVI